MKYKIIACDLDETLIRHDRSISKEDVEAIKKATGLGVGVQNTVEDIKKYCDYITSATCNESAVAEVINKFVLNL